MDTHLVFAGKYYLNKDKLKSFILKGMEKYNIKKVMVTQMYRWRNSLITMERMVDYCKGKEREKISVNDDLNLVFEAIRLDQEPDYHEKTYFLPMLTGKELELVERKSTRYFQTFWSTLMSSDRSHVSLSPDVKETEMKLSESNSKFVYSWGERRTFTIINTSYSRIADIERQHQQLSKLKTPSCCSLQ